MPDAGQRVIIGPAAEKRHRNVPWGCANRVNYSPDIRRRRVDFVILPVDAFLDLFFPGISGLVHCLLLDRSGHLEKVSDT